MTFRVTFRWYDTDTYCTNICIADDIQKVRDHYAKYHDPVHYGGHSDVNISEITDDELRSAEKRGMPIIRL